MLIRIRNEPTENTINQKELTMRKTILVKSNMLILTRDYLLNNASITASISQFALLFTQFTNDIDLLQNLREQFATNHSGVTENKNILKADLITELSDLIRRILVYAKITNNQILETEVNYTDKKLDVLTNNDLCDISQIIYARGNANSTALASYGVTATTLSTVKTAIDSFTQALPQIALIRKERKTINMQIDELLKKIMAELHILDCLIDILKKAQPNFHEGYKEARRIDKTAFNTLSLIGKAKDAGTGKDLSRATISINPALTTAADTTTTALITKKIAGKGGFKVKSLPEGNYTLTISKYGYETQEINFSINGKETTRVHLSLEKQEHPG